MSTGVCVLWVFPKYMASLTASPMNTSQTVMATMDSSSPVYQMITEGTEETEGMEGTVAMEEEETLVATEEEEGTTKT